MRGRRQGRGSLLAVLSLVLVLAAYFRADGPSGIELYRIDGTHGGELHRMLP